MTTSSILLWSLICCNLLGFTSSFQKRFAHSPTAFRISTYDLPKYQRSQSCLFGKRCAGHVAAWNARYQELAQFYEKHGHFRVEYQSRLYTWIGNQRRKRKGVKELAPLTDEQIQLLDEIDFPWDPKQGGEGFREKIWFSKYQELADFYKKHGHLRVESRSTLDQWMVTQRRKRKGVQGYTPLTDEQTQLLDEIDFPWGPRTGPQGGVNLKAWAKKYDDLTDFYKKHGHLRVNYNATPTLYRWLVVQRRRLKGVKGLPPLSNEQTQLLEIFNFPRDMHEEKWSAHYQELAEFYKKHGHLRVEYQSRLYVWMITQRKRRNGAKGHAPLTEEQIQLLDAIEFSWDVRTGPRGGLDEKAWIAKYEELVKFYKKHGHLSVHHSVTPSLYSWVHVQRKRLMGARGLAPLAEEQIQMLEKIGFD